jgi:Asp-tRNA(Asn)/Glu-tRNA(Gln) amidotransferase A subunit family amidase
MSVQLSSSRSLAGSTEVGHSGMPAMIGRATDSIRAKNYLGRPSDTAPCGFADDGLAISFRRMNLPRAEEALLRTANTRRRLTDWPRLVPPLAATPRQAAE